MHVLTTIPLCLVAGTAVAVLASPFLALAVRTLEGAPPLPLHQTLLLGVLGVTLLGVLGPWVAIPVAQVERARLRLVDESPALDPSRRPSRTGLWPWLRTRAGDAATWRAVAFMIVLATVIPTVLVLLVFVLVFVLALVAAPLVLLSDAGPIAMGPTEITSATESVPYALVGVLLLVGVPYLVAAVAAGHGWLVRLLLTQPEEADLRHQLVEVSRSRTRLVDAFEAERRRIERDLHDGAQSQLLNLTLKLGVARLDLDEGSPAAQKVTEAHGMAKGLMAELRQIVRGIHPRVLTDQGLHAALWELCDDVTLPVDVEVVVPERLPEHVEASAYFTVMEAMNNVTKHAGAEMVAIRAWVDEDLLLVEVEDDGCGGADPSAGSGLTGSADRIAAVGGRMHLSSPPGGPTLVRVEVPTA